MARNKDVFDFFREREGQLSEAPSAHTWRRLERRLDNHQQRNRRSLFRALAMAAGVMLLALVIVLISLILDSRSWKNGAGYQAAPSQLEDLQQGESGEASIHTVQAAQRAQKQRLRPISEGIAGQKLMLANGADAGPKLNASPNMIQRFEWLLGRWEAQEQGRPLVEEWKQASETAFEGMAIIEENGGAPERMRLFAKEGKLFFTTDFGGEVPVQYQLLALHGQEALFENLEQGFPQQVRLLHQGPGQLMVIYQNNKAEQLDSGRLHALSRHHTILPMQAIRRLGRVSLQ